MHGIDTDAGRQMQWLRDHVLPYEPEYRGNRRYQEAVEASFGPGYGYIEAQCLHGVIRALKPRRIIEVGSGNSTHVMLGALESNAADGRDGQLTCIEPFPSQYLKDNRAIELISSPVEDLDPATFDSLEAGDLLFIDSSHAIRPGGDVAYLYLSVLPRLKPGVHVHIHDIFLPAEYRREWLFHGRMFWTEQYLVQAMLANNPTWEIVWGGSYMHLAHSDRLRQAFRSYGDGAWPASLWLRKTRLGTDPSSAERSRS